MGNWLKAVLKGLGVKAGLSGPMAPKADPARLRAAYSQLDRRIFEPPARIIPADDMVHIGRQMLDTRTYTPEQLRTLDTCYAYLEQGDMQFNAGDFLGAAKTFAECLNVIPHAEVPASRRAYAFGYAGMIEESIGCFGEALRFDCTDNESWYLLGEICAMGDPVLGLHAVTQSFVHRGSNMLRHQNDGEWAHGANNRSPYTYGRALRYLESPYHCMGCNNLLSPYPEGMFCRYCYSYEKDRKEDKAIRAAHENTVNFAEHKWPEAVKCARLLVAYPGKVDPSHMPEASSIRV